MINMNLNKREAAVTCPFCCREMKRGTLKVGGSLPPKWVGDSDSPSFFGGRIIRSFRIRNSQFEADGFLCSGCGKLMIDAKL